MADRMDRFEEPLEVLEALKANYSAADDLEKVVAVHRLQEELAELCRVREDEVAGIVRNLCTLNDQREAEMRDAASEVADNTRAQQLTSEICQLQEELEQLSSIASTDLEQAKARQQDHGQSVQRWAEKVDAISAHAEPRIRNELSLYAHISHLTWKMDGNDGPLKGTYSNPATKTLRLIKIDPSNTLQCGARFDMVNAVWDAIA